MAWVLQLITNRSALCPLSTVGRPLVTGHHLLCYIYHMEKPNPYRELQEQLRKAWDELDYAHLWLTASEWDEQTNLDDKLNSAQQKARAYLELVDRISWTMRKG
jgi:hypothetical protein